MSWLGKTFSKRNVNDIQKPIINIERSLNGLNSITKSNSNHEFSDEKTPFTPRSMIGFISKTTSNDKPINRYINEISKNLKSIYKSLGDIQSAIIKNVYKHDIIVTILKSNMLMKLSENFCYLTNESRKYYVNILKYIIKSGNIGWNKYLCKTEGFIGNLLELCLNKYGNYVGYIFNDITKNKKYVGLLMECKGNDDIFIRIIDSILSGHGLDVKSKFSILSNVIFLDEGNSFHRICGNYDEFVTEYNKMISCNNYFIQVYSMRIMFKMLYNKNNGIFMKTYLKSCDNLILYMNILRNQKNNNTVIIECYHIIKLFICNPNKSQKVHILLWNNKLKLNKVLTNHAKVISCKDENVLSDIKIVTNALQCLTKPDTIKA